jgi:hypothetical protein
MPPLPSDISDRWSQKHQLIISCKFTPHMVFIRAFDHAPSLVKEVGYWISDPPYKTPKFFEGRLERLGNKGLKKLVDGWYSRDIMAYYQRQNFHWQSCWFQHRLDEQVAKRFRKCLAGLPIENTSDTDTSYDSDESCWSFT